MMVTLRPPSESICSGVLLRDGLLACFKSSAGPHPNHVGDFEMGVAVFDMGDVSRFVFLPAYNSR